MKNQTYEEAVLKCVMWWSDKSFRTPLNQNNGDKSSQGGIVSILHNTISLKAQEKLTEEKITKFEEKLSELLLSEKDAKYNRAKLDVDYSPCETLFQACQYAGIDSHCLPCKSHSYIDENNNAFAKYQYGSQTMEI